MTLGLIIIAIIIAVLWYIKRISDWCEYQININNFKLKGKINESISNSNK